ncbi:MAG: hypothetical protein KF751_02920 [Nitrospira sp.]|nr:hypothetical protein [Nitrospira sp.]MBX3348948.1 hypothetical protein [Nitrospira sp.]
MHNIDRTQMEYNHETGFETNHEQFEGEQFEGEQFEYGETSEWGEVFSEAELMEIASELLEVRDEAELDRFLGSLIKKAGSALGKIVKSPVGQAIGGILKGAAKRALPIAGAALGGWVGGPIGAKIGSGLANVAGKALGLELEALSAEDREFEGAKQFVRFAGEAVRNAAMAPPAANLQAVANAAAAAAARKFAPGLLAGGGSVGVSTPAGSFRRGGSGRWVRRGNRIILFGV